MKLILLRTFMRLYLNITLLLIKCMLPWFVLCSSMVDGLLPCSFILSSRHYLLSTFIISAAEFRTPSWVFSLYTRNLSTLSMSDSSLITRSISRVFRQMVRQFQAKNGTSSNCLSSSMLMCFLSIQNREDWPPNKMLWISLTLHEAPDAVSSNLTPSDSSSISVGKLSPML